MLDGTSMSNTGAQTVFLMPNGDMVMPNYDEFNNIEFMISKTNHKIRKLIHAC
jgi:hypothetical protein